MIPRLKQAKSRKRLSTQEAKRRPQTEARISICKNAFLKTPLLSKGHENQSREESMECAGAQSPGDCATAARPRHGLGEGELSVAAIPNNMKARRMRRDRCVRDGGKE